MNEALQILGNNLRAERNRQRLSQEQLAEMAGLQMQHVSKIENGQTDIRFTTLIAILKALNIPFEKLYEL
ncbi:MAG: helix-turn-helix transcriptional regulator [Brachyspira sp.]|jgi:uncharacterized HTH-type transcriptional regulator in smaI restriction system 5'region|nr:helix-turn-helix transcriptional regulator [Brachyspira sp.]CCY23850.1 xRE [Brachyspira sp. CAG:484]